MTDSASVNLGGQASISADGSWNIDGAINGAIDDLEGHAPGFVKSLEAGAAAGAAAYGAVVASVTEAAGFITADAAALAAVSSLVPIAGLAVAIVVGLLAADSASSGPGCCGPAPLSREQATAMLRAGQGIGIQVQGLPQVEQLMRFGSCDPHGYLWTADAMWGSYSAPSLAGELYVSNMVRAAFERGTDCWHTFPKNAYGQQLALAIGIWNRTHAATSKKTIIRHVNVPKSTTFGGKQQPWTMSPQNSEPISVAMQTMAGQLPPNAPMSFTLNTGAAIRGNLVANPGARGGALLGGTPHLIPIRAGATHPQQPPKLVPIKAKASTAAGVAVGSGLALFLLLRRF